MKQENLPTNKHMRNKFITSAIHYQSSILIFQHSSATLMHQYQPTSQNSKVAYFLQT